MLSYAVVFVLLGGVLLAPVVVTGGEAGWWLVWPGVSFALLGLAYVGVGPRLLGKRPDGRLAPWAWALFLPYLLINYALWRLVRLLDRKTAFQELLPGVWVGRRPLPHEVPEGVTLVVDLTAEFPEAPAVRRGRAYRSLPTLDATVPDPGGFRERVREAAAWPGGVLIHCALGHGRTGMFAAGVLLAKGVCADPMEAERRVREIRAGVRLHPKQRAALRQPEFQARPEMLSEGETGR